MRADINWIIPDIMTKTYDLQRETLVSHKSPQFFDEKDSQRQWYLKIGSERGIAFDKPKLILYIWGKQPHESSIDAKFVTTVIDEKEGQPRQLIFQNTTHSRPNRILGPYGNIAELIRIGGLE